MQSRIYRFEIVRALANAVFEARDSTTGAAAVLYEWTPAAAAREVAKTRLEELAPTLQAEVFTADASLYLAAPTQASAQQPLEALRAQGLFTGTWLNDAQAPPPPAAVPIQPVLPPAVPLPLPPPPPRRRSPFATFLLTLVALGGGALLGANLWPAHVPKCPAPIIDNTATQALTDENQRLQTRLKDLEVAGAGRQKDLEGFAGTHLLRVRNACSTPLRAAAEYTGFNGQKEVQGWTSIAPGATGVVAASATPDFLLYAVSPTGQAWGSSEQTLDVVTANFLYTLADGLTDETRTQVGTLVVHSETQLDVVSLTCSA